MTADLKQQVREAVKSLRLLAIQDQCAGGNLSIYERYAVAKSMAKGIADGLEAAAAAEPEYEVRWTYGDGGDGYDIFDTAQRAWLHTNPSTPGEEHTVRRVFIEPVPPKPEPKLSVEDATEAFVEASLRVKYCGEGLDAAKSALEDLDRAHARALARERGA